MENVLSTYGKEQEAIFICNVMLTQENLSSVRIQEVIVVSWTKIVSEGTLVRGRL